MSLETVKVFREDACIIGYVQRSPAPAGATGSR
jgi:hypothetical protein